MHVFTNCIAVGGFSGDGANIDAMLSEHLLEIVSNEFAALIMVTIEWARIA